MMDNNKIVISLTKKGVELAERIALALQAPLKIPQRFARDMEDPRGFQGKAGTVIQEAFLHCDTLVLVMAAGIAVRSIAPVLQHKSADPAVIVVDEEGRFVISLLSGRWGGANQTAAELADYLHGVAVITTASEITNLPGLDTMAGRNGLLIENPELLPGFSGAIVNGDPVVVWDRWGIEETWPENVRLENGDDLNFDPDEKLLVTIGYHKPRFTPRDMMVLGLRPPCLVVGIGCAKGISGIRIAGAIRRYFRERCWSAVCIKGIATIDLQADEPGIREACQEFGVPLFTYNAAELKTMMPGLRVADFMDETTGAAGVCEPAAILGAHKGRLIGIKENMGQVTVAVALDLGD